MGISKKEALQAIEREREMICAASDAVWDHPETAFQEFKSTEILCELMEKEGFSVERNLAGIQTAFSGRFGHGKPVVGILGEFDALSGLSQESESIEKVPVCEGEPGHGSGKGFMARDGVFDELDFAISWHPGDQNEVSVGSSLANYQVFYRFFGTASHAAACPELGRSALDAVELMNTGVQYLREHAIQEARIHYAITNTGGYSPNVVQPFAEVLYLIRAPKNDQVKELFERVNDIARGAALMTGTRMEMQFVKACSNVVDNTVLEEVLQKNLEEVEREPYTEAELEFAKKLAGTYGGGELDVQDLLKRYEKSRKAEVEAFLNAHKDDVICDYIVPLKDTEPVMAGSTDVGDVSWVCPTAQINAVTEAAGTPGHSWQQVSQGKSSIAHKGMLFAGKVMAGAIIDVLEDQRLIGEAKDELKKRVGEAGYVAPIPKDVRPMAINPKK